MAGQLERVTVKIASGASVSGEIDLRGRRLVALQGPSAWTAARLTVLARATNVAVNGGGGSVVDAPTAESALGGIGSGTDTGAGTLIVVAVDAALQVAHRWLTLSSTLRTQLDAIPYITLRSTNTASAAAVNQGADRFIHLICEPRGV